METNGEQGFTCTAAGLFFKSYNHVRVRITTYIWRRHFAFDSGTLVILPSIYTGNNHKISSLCGMNGSVMMLIALWMLLHQVLPRKAWTRDVPLFHKDPNHCATTFNEELHANLGTRRVVKVFTHFSSGGRRSGSLPTICGKFYKRDGLHPNATGTKLLGALICRSVISTLGGRKTPQEKPMEEVKPPVSEIHQPESTSPHIVFRDTCAPPPPSDDHQQFPSLPRQVVEGVSSSPVLLTGYSKAVLRVKESTVGESSIPLPRKKTKCECMIYVV